MKRLPLLFITLLLCSIVLSGCGNQSSLKKDADVQAQIDAVKAAQQAAIDEKQAEVDMQKQVIEKYTNERKVIGTGRFVEDAATAYPNNVVINTIYNYDTAVDCIDFAPDQLETNWMEQARTAAAKISPSYTGPFSDEIISFCKKLLGNDWASIAKSTKEMEAKFANLSQDDKKAIYEYIQGQYDAYDAKEGQSTGDKYSKVIWEDAVKKYGLPQDLLMKIWCDTDVMQAASDDNPEDSATSLTSDTVTQYDATLDYNGAESLIAVSEDAMNQYLTALNKKDDGTLQEMQNNNLVATVTIGIKVNIIKEKVGMTQVEILDGLYKGNTVWTLVESIHRK